MARLALCVQNNYTLRRRNAAVCQPGCTKPGFTDKITMYPHVYSVPARVTLIPSTLPLGILVFVRSARGPSFSVGSRVGQSLGRNKEEHGICM